MQETNIQREATVNSNVSLTARKLALAEAITRCSVSLKVLLSLDHVQKSLTRGFYKFTQLSRACNSISRPIPV